MLTDRPRILMVNQFYPPDTAATGQLLSDLADAFVADGWETHILASRRSYDGGRRWYRSRDSRRGALIHRVPGTGFGRRGTLGRLLDYSSFYTFAWAKAQSLPDMDVCLCLTTPPLLANLGVGLRRRRGTRLMIWSMDLYPEMAVECGWIAAKGLAHRTIAKLQLRNYREADAVIALGDQMRQHLRRAGAHQTKIDVVHNWVPGEVVEPTDLPQRDTVTILYSGNLGVGQDLDAVLRAVAGLEDRKHIRLRFVGEGKMRPSLELMAHELGLAGSVEFLPPVPLSRLSQNLADGDIHLVSQKPGTQGLLVPSKLYGSLAAGRPILYVGPMDTEVAEIVRDSGAGVAVTGAETWALSDAIRKLAGDIRKRRKMGQAARQCYETQFGRARSTGQIVAEARRQLDARGAVAS